MLKLIKKSFRILNSKFLLSNPVPTGCCSFLKFSGLTLLVYCCLYKEIYQLSPTAWLLFTNTKATSRVKLINCYILLLQIVGMG